MRGANNEQWQQWWPSMMSKFPLLYIAAENILLGPSSEMGCERVHSVVRLIMTRLRLSLNGVTITNLTLLSCVLRQLAVMTSDIQAIDALIEDLKKDLPEHVLDSLSEPEAEAEPLSSDSEEEN